jgi:hypothetical protein
MWWCNIYRISAAMHAHLPAIRCRRRVRRRGGAAGEVQYRLERVERAGADVAEHDSSDANARALQCCRNVSRYVRASIHRRRGERRLRPEFLESSSRIEGLDCVLDLHRPTPSWNSHNTKAWRGIWLHPPWELLRALQPTRGLALRVRGSGSRLLPPRRLGCASSALGFSLDTSAANERCTYPFDRRRNQLLGLSPRGQSMTPAQNKAHQMRTGCISSLGP